jgi:biotin carboxyl carrier protein
MSIATKILTAVLLILSVGMFVYLYGSVNDVIETREAIANQEAAVTDKLKLIREAEIVFLSVYGRYTANWDSLSNFIQNGRVPIIQRREEIIQKAYGGEDVVVHVDTLGFVSAKERIFKKNYTVNAADDGVLVAYKAKVGQQVVRNQKALSLRVLNQVKEQPFLEEGTIESLTVQPGDSVKKGQILITYWENVFDVNTDVSRIGQKPNSDQTFDIFVGKVDKAGVMVQVIEVKDPKPDNPMRKESNEQKPRKPLRFGSRVDVSTAGNWESN